jgi:hypothetical protein
LINEIYGSQAGVYEDNMTISILCNVKPCCLVYNYTDVSKQPAEEEVFPCDEENRYLLKVCVKVKSGEWSAGKWFEVKWSEAKWSGVEYSEVKRSEAKW